MTWVLVMLRLTYYYCYKPNHNNYFNVYFKMQLLLLSNLTPQDDNYPVLLAV
jgi:hypothetical protein